MSIKSEWAKIDKAFNDLSKTFTSGIMKEGPLRGVTTSTIGIEETILNLRNLSTFVKMKAAMMLSEIGIDLLYNALPRTPQDTGQLKDSSTVTLSFFGTYKNIARGTKDDYVNIIGEPSLNQIRNANQINVLVYFTRTNEFGEDIALWAHEELNPYGSSTHPRARKPGTGPKYLEGAWLDNKSKYISRLQSVGNIAEDVQAGLEMVHKAKDKNAVDVVRLNLSKLLGNLKGSIK